MPSMLYGIGANANACSACSSACSSPIVVSLPDAANRPIHQHLHVAHEAMQPQGCFADEATGVVPSQVLVDMVQGSASLSNCLSVSAAGPTQRFYLPSAFNRQTAVSSHPQTSPHTQVQSTHMPWACNVYNGDLAMPQSPIASGAAPRRCAVVPAAAGWVPDAGRYQAVGSPCGSVSSGMSADAISCDCEMECDHDVCDDGDDACSAARGAVSDC